MASLTAHSYHDHLSSLIFNLQIRRQGLKLEFFGSRYRVESRIADAICKNKRLLKVGLKFQFTEVMDRVQVRSSRHNGPLLNEA